MRIKTLVFLALNIQAFLFGSSFGDDCVTVDKDKCHFPLTYMGKKYEECIPYKDSFWCSSVPEKEYMPGAGVWGYCDPKTCEPTKASFVISEKDCVTVKDNRNVNVRKCHFPFTYGGKVYTKCAAFKRRYWCSYTPDYNPEHWGFCDETRCQDKGLPGWLADGSCVTVGANGSAGKCKFPWKNGGNECIKWTNGKYWCLKSDNAKDWDYCDESLCPPTYIDQIKAFDVKKKGWIRMYRRMGKVEAEGVLERKGLKGREETDEIWMSTSLKHSRQFENKKVVNNQDDVVIAFKVDIDCFIDKFKKNIIDQSGSGQFNNYLELENLKCLVNNERLTEHEWGKLNFCLKGNPNAEKFNTCIKGVKKLMIKKEGGKVIIFNPDDNSEIHSSGTDTDGKGNCF